MKKYIHRFLPFITCLVLVLTGTAACQNREADTGTQNKPDSTSQTQSSIADVVASMNMYFFKEPVQAPSFELPSVNDKTHTIEQYKGKTVLLSFWATW